MSRIHPFESVENFRDYGDYATAAGRRLRPGRLLRSGHHARASDEDLRRLAALAPALIVDLRRKDWVAARDFDQAIACSDELRPLIEESLRELAPMVDYLCAALDLQF